MGKRMGRWMAALCLVMVSCMTLRAQEIAIEDLSGFNYLRTGQEKEEKLVFMDSFLSGKKGQDLLRRYLTVMEDMAMKKPLSYNPETVIENLKRYAIGRRAWANVNYLGDGYLAVSDGANSWGIMTLDGSFTIPLGYLNGMCSNNRKNKLMAAWKNGADCGLITYNGQEISDFKYDNIQAFYDGFAIAQLKNTGDMVLLAPEKGSSVTSFYKEVSDVYYDIVEYSFEDSEGKDYRILTVRDSKKTTGAIDVHGNVIIPVKYMGAAVSDGRDFGRPERVFMYWRGTRKDGEKMVCDYYYAPSLKLVYTGDYK